MILLLLSTIACMAAFRLRGDEIWDKLTGTGATGGRLLWSLTASLCLMASGGGIWGLAAAPILFLSAIPGWPGSIDLGRNEGDWHTDFAFMCMRGAVFTAPAGLVLIITAGSEFIPFAISGLFAGICYELAWRLPVKWQYLRQGPPLGEAFFGAFIGATIGFAAL